MKEMKLRRQLDAPRHSGRIHKRGPGFFEIATIFILLSSVFLFGAVQPVVLYGEEFLIFSLFIILMVTRLTRQRPIKTSPLFIPFLVFIASILIQLIPLPFPLLKLISPQAAYLKEVLGQDSALATLSLIPIRTVSQFLRWTSVFLLYLLIINVFDHRSLSRLLNALFVLTLFEALYGLFLSFTGSKWLLWYHKQEYGNFGHRVHGTYRNPDHLAGYLEMVIPVHIVQVISRRFPTPFHFEEKARKMVGILLVMVFSLAFFFTISRAGITAFLVGMTYLYFSGKKDDATKFTRYMKVFVALIFIYLLWVGMGPIIERFMTSQASLRHGRILVWQDTLKLVRDFPVFGAGYGTFQFIFTKYQHFPSRVVWDYAHNDYLQFLAEGGILGLLSFLWIVVRGLLSLHRKRDIPLARGVTAGIIAILIHSFFDFNLQIPANAWIFVTLLAIGWVCKGEHGDHDRHPLPSAARD